MKNKLIFFLSLLALWLVLSWSVSMDELFAGFIFSALTVFISDKIFGAGPDNANPFRYLWFVVYFLALLWDIMRSCADALYRLIHPALISKPRILDIKTTLRNDTAIGLLSGTLSLMPGTLTVDFNSQNNVFHVYCLVGMTPTYSSVIELLIFKYENILKKVYA